MAIPAIAIGLGVAALGQIGVGIAATRAAKEAQDKAEAREIAARAEMNRMKQAFANVDTSNPYLNMENTMEDLTINQKQAEFQRQQFQQSQANILNQMKGAAGGSGIAALAQSLSQQGQIAAQQSAASIGQQESANQRAKAQEASRLQGLERQGIAQQRQAEFQKAGTLLGISQQETAQAAAEKLQAQQARFEAMGGIFGGIMDTASNIAGAFGGGGMDW